MFDFISDDADLLKSLSIETVPRLSNRRSRLFTSMVCFPTPFHMIPPLVLKGPTEKLALPSSKGPTQSLENSDRIFFLGVGYHKANMEIFGFDFTQKRPNKIIAGTGFGLPPQFAQSLLDQYPAINRIEACDALTFLRTKFDIGDPSKNALRISKSILDVL